MDKFHSILATIIILFLYLLAFAMGSKQAQKDMLETLGTPITTYYFVNPEVVDVKANATSDLFVKGELKMGVCYEK